MELRILDALPEGLLTCDANQLEANLGGPSLIHIAGDREPALFVSVLLHGNETSGWNGLRRFLQSHTRPPRSLLLFIGNVFAATKGVRVLPDQQDYNRIWRDAMGEEARLSAAVLSEMGKTPLFAGVDLHNNTGRNPHYSVITELDPAVLGLACLFSDKAVYIVEPDTTLGRAFRGICPGVTLELGPVGDPRCDERAFDYLEMLTHLKALPAPDLHNLKLYRSLGRMHVPDDVAFSFADNHQPAELVLTSGLEALNFHELPAASEFGLSQGNQGIPLQVLSPTHTDITDQFLTLNGNRILTRKSFVPAMYTVDPAVVRQDCLCYLMERISFA